MKELERLISKVELRLSIESTKICKFFCRLSKISEKWYHIESMDFCHEFTLEIIIYYILYQDNRNIFFELYSFVTQHSQQGGFYHSLPIRQIYKDRVQWKIIFYLMTSFCLKYLGNKSKAKEKVRVWHQR